MELDYQWTCGIIDEAISGASSDIEGMIHDALEECTPELTIEQKESIIECMDYGIAAPHFESCRSCNEGMREAANNQLHL